MTLNEAKRLTAQTQAPQICIAVEVWVRGPGERRFETEFTMWDGKKNHVAPTLEEAVAKFMAANPIPQKANTVGDEQAVGVFAEAQGAD